MLYYVLIGSMKADFCLCRQHYRHGMGIVLIGLSPTAWKHSTIPPPRQNWRTKKNWRKGSWGNYDGVAQE